MNLKLSKASIFLTHACNLSCDYCFDQNHSQGNLTKTIAEQAIRWFLDNADGAFSFTLFGGEPLLRPDFVRWFLERASEEADRANVPVRFNVTTNGTMLDDNVAQTLKQFDCRLTLSADGIRPSQDLHRRMATGISSFDMVERGSQYVLDIYPQATSRMTYTPRNIQFLAEGVQHYFEKGFQCICPALVFEDRWDDDAIQCYAQGLETASALLTREALAGRIVVIAGITEPLLFLLGVRGGSRVCGAGYTYLAMDVDGSLFPCHRFIGYTNSASIFKLGNVFEGIQPGKDPLSGAYVKNMRGCGRQANGFEVSCQTCPLAQPCGGGCMAVNYAVSGDAFAPLGIYNQLQAIQIEIADRVIRYISGRYPAAWDTYLARLRAILSRTPGEEGALSTNNTIEEPDALPSFHQVLQELQSLRLDVTPVQDQVVDEILAFRTEQERYIPHSDEYFIECPFTDDCDGGSSRACVLLD